MAHTDGSTPLAAGAAEGGGSRRGQRVGRRGCEVVAGLLRPAMEAGRPPGAAWAPPIGPLCPGRAAHSSPGPNPTQPCHQMVARLLLILLVLLMVGAHVLVWFLVRSPSQAAARGRLAPPPDDGPLLAPAEVELGLRDGRDLEL